MNTRTFTVTLEDLSQYAVTATYSVWFEYDTFSCSLDIKAVQCLTKPVSIDGSKMTEIESALAYLIIDEQEDLASYRHDISNY